MKRCLPAIALLALVPASHAAEPRLPVIPPQLALAETSGSHRLLAFQECSEENCWHRLYVQELGLSPHRKILCSRAVAELNRNENFMVSNAEWQPGPAPVLALMLHSPQDEFIPYAATLSFAGNCRYKFQPGAAPLPEAPTETAAPAP